MEEKKRGSLRAFTLTLVFFGRTGVYVWVYVFRVFRRGGFPGEGLWKNMMHAPIRSVANMRRGLDDEERETNEGQERLPARHAQPKAVCGRDRREDECGGSLFFPTDLCTHVWACE